jgi:DNA-binding NtrC family response regulator
MDAFRSACDDIGLVGGRLRENLAAQVQSALVARQAKDVVRLTGPTGTGKELVASLLHEMGRRALGRRGEFVRVSCSNLPAGLFESTLFGHKRGAFTGATADAKGLLRQARNGTLLLDEVQNLGWEDQGKLLRLIGEREFRPLGSTTTERTDALIVLVSNVDLVEAAKRGEFRRDLLDRAQAKIILPPLWQRREDVSELAQSFAREAAGERGWVEFEGFTRRALADIEGAVLEKREESVRRLREMVRDLVFGMSEPVEAIESSVLRPHLEAFFDLETIDRDRWDREAIDAGFDQAVERRTAERLAALHGVPEHTLVKLAQIMREVYDALPEGANPVPGSYRNLVSRMNLATKAALWLMSGARNQAEFRRFFGSRSFEMPPKSVAWQIYHELFGEGGSVR